MEIRVLRENIEAAAQEVSQSLNSRAASRSGSLQSFHTRSLGVYPGRCLTSMAMHRTEGCNTGRALGGVKGLFGTLSLTEMSTV